MDNGNGMAVYKFKKKELDNQSEMKKKNYCTSKKER